jgi:hypothetical protein
MSCQCHQAGGPFVAEDPDCPYHGAEGRREREQMEDRIAALESALRAMLTDVVPHTRDTGHNAADREMREAIKTARALVAA